MDCDVLKYGGCRTLLRVEPGGSVHCDITPGIVPSSCSAREESIWSKGTIVIWAINVYLAVLNEYIYIYLNIPRS